VSGYFASTFSWQEITQMRAAQPLTFRDQSYNGKYQCVGVAEQAAMTAPHRLNLAASPLL